MARTAVIKVLVEPEDKSLLERAASTDGRTVSNYVERLIQRDLQEKGLK